MNLHEILATLRVPGSQYADLFFERLGVSLISLEDGRLEKVVNGLEEGLGLRVVAGWRTNYAHTNTLTATAVHDLAAELAGQIRGQGPPVVIEAITLRGPAAESNSLDIDRRIALVREADRIARARHASVRQVSVTFAEKKQDLEILGPDREAAGTRLETIFAVQVVVAEGDLLQRGYEAEGRSEGSAFITAELVETLTIKTVDRAVRMLRARPAPPGAMPVVLSSEAGGTMVHESIGHGLENDLAGQGFSVYSGRVGEMVASPLVSVVDDPTLPGRRGSYPFDDEGTPTRPTVLVDCGRLTGFISDIVTAARFGGTATGNGRRQSFRHPPISRMSNTLILPGTSDPASILRQTPAGLFVVKMGGGQVNTINGDFVFEVSEGYLIDGGAIGEPVRGALLVGNGPQALKEIDLVGSDLGFAIGTCGKDGQGVPVADAQPTLRIPSLTVGGTVK